MKERKKERKKKGRGSLAPFRLYVAERNLVARLSPSRRSPVRSRDPRSNPLSLRLSALKSNGSKCSVSHPLCESIYPPQRKGNENKRSVGKEEGASRGGPLVTRSGFLCAGQLAAASTRKLESKPSNVLSGPETSLPLPVSEPPRRPRPGQPPGQQPHGIPGSWPPSTATSACTL